MEKDIKDFTTEELLQEIISRNDIRDRSLYDETEYEVQVPVGDSGLVRVGFDCVEADILEVVI